jgi:peptide/nickel transport system permease protein
MMAAEETSTFTSIGRTARSSGRLREAMARLGRSKSALIGGSLLALIALSAICASLISPYGPTQIDMRSSLTGPSIRHLMGADRLGRDMLARVLWGGRISLPVGMVAVAIAALTGVFFGLIAGYVGGRTDSIIMRCVDVLLAFPGILLAIAIIATLGPSLVNLMIAVGISAVPDYVRVTRGNVLIVKELEFVTAARVIGCPTRAIIFRHILPNVLTSIIVLATMGVASAIITAAALSFLGIGISPPTPEWGSMLADGRNLLQHAWWISFFPGLAIMLTVFAINLLGDGLADALNPRVRM